ncbi:GNAT family N-acetyltransferase [Psychromicrobium sp. YIM B11713]|uniref:GNAT family N-acetyltransferase n=1 Tax=Psychromicrobium sp. YIM B11713 TaxID=3145233 RepID=UPI00374F805E
MQNTEPELQIRPPVAREYQEISELVSEAFGESGDDVAALVEKLRELWTAERGFELVASSLNEKSQPRVLGHIGFTRGYLDAPEKLHHVLVLSPLAVRPDTQGKSIGSALVRRGLELAAQLGFSLVFLEGAPSFYPRLGFVPGAEAGFVKPSARIPDPAFLVHHLSPEAKSLSGALIYPEVFWETDSVGLRDV